MEKGIRIGTVILLWLLMSGVTNIYAQPCLPNGITFTSQSEIDNFQTNYPNCNEIEGWVRIEGNDITNLYGLGVLTSIGSYLWIYGTSLVDLSGLDNLATIGGSLHLGQDAYVSWNRYLVSLAGGNSLTSIGGVFNLERNIVLSDISALSKLNTIGSNLNIANNDSLKNMIGFDNLGYIGNDLIIEDNNALESLLGLAVLSSISGHLKISGNTSLFDLSGMDNLSHIGGAISISNSYLTNISALSSLDTLGTGISLFMNSQLTDITGLLGIDLFWEGGGIHINFNQALTSLSGLDSIDSESIMVINISNNGLLTECAVKSICDYLADPNGEIYIFSNDIGCNSQAEVEESCIVGIHDQLYDTQLSAYPNPFTTSSTISFTLDENSKISISVFNILGELVFQREHHLEQGDHQFSWSPHLLPTGLYFAVLRSKERVSVVKLLKE